MVPIQNYHPNLPVNVPGANVQPIYPNVNPVNPSPSLLFPTRVPAAIYKETRELIIKAYELKESILRGNHQGIQQQPVRGHHRQNASPININYVSINNRPQHHGRGRHNQKDDDSAQRLFVGIISFLGTLALAFYMGKTVVQAEEEQAKIFEYEKLKSTWRSNKNHYDTRYQVLLDGVINRVDNILHRKETNRTQKIALIVLGLIAGGAAFGGALVGSGGLIALGIGVGAVASAIAVYKLAYACFSTQDQREAQLIENDLVELNRCPLVITP
jgi:ferritin-like metal-binding protein YciE